MSDNTKWFRDPETGKTALYPARFLDLFPHLEEIDEDEAYCIDCQVPAVSEDAETIHTQDEAAATYDEQFAGWDDTQEDED